MMPKSMPSSSSRSYSIFGIIAVARSRVLVDCRPQLPSIAMPRRLRSASVRLSEFGNAPLRGEKPVGALVADRLADLLGEDRRVFDPMAVAVDDRMAEFGMDLLRAQMTAHGLLHRKGGRR